jgi:sterol desaturase/sphingolipid hydroxylase (fatty acid hydroxylase superfamily)
MPTPLDLLLDPMTQIMLAMFALLAIAERLFPGRPLPRVPGWHTRALAVFAAYFLLSSYLPLLWADALAPLQLLDLSGWPMGAAMALGLVVYEPFGYAYHRGMHSIDAWFRVSHQMHHSAERFDVYGAFWFSPLDIVGWTLVPSVALTLLGLPPAPATATATMLMITILGIFQHANLRTPHWLGYLVQRPEGHAIHHQRGVHAFNYGNLALFDQLFGTYRNPREYSDERAGFWDGASREVSSMLIGKDIADPRPSLLEAPALAE